MTLWEIMKNTGGDVEFPGECVEGYLKICCEKGEPKLCFEEDAPPLMGNTGRPCGCHSTPRVTLEGYTGEEIAKILSSLRS